MGTANWPHYDGITSITKMFKGKDLGFYRELNRTGWVEGEIVSS